jgi:hypothetical protein
MNDRNDTIKRIKTALQRRSGKAWSVTGGRGTAWGWIHITAPPARRTWGSRLKEGATNDWPESWEKCDIGKPGCSMSPSDIEELATLLNLDRRQCDGIGVPASSDYRREYIDRAEGRTPAKIAEPYWD